MGRRHAPYLQARAERFLARLKLGRCELSVLLVGDARIRTLNREWRGKDESTDVLSFPAGDWPKGAGPRPLGDVVISLDTTLRNARAYGHTIEDELARYLAHGLLHLLGHDHERPKDAAKMAAAETRLLGRAGMLG